MSRVTALLSLTLLCILPALTLSHLCIISPQQRGELKVPHNCYKPKGPCGEMAAEAPKVTYKAGKTYDVQFVQALNHYAIGYPGVFEVSWNQDGTEQAFEVLSNIPDYFSHRELYETNMTYRFTAPMAPTEHGVLRFKYISHKPGEPEAFHQCVDVKVVKDDTVAAQQRTRVVSEAPKQAPPTRGIYAVMYNPAQIGEASTSIVQIDPETGDFEAVDHIPVPLRTMRQFNMAPSFVMDRHQFALATAKYVLIEDVVTYVDDVQTLVYLLGYDDPHQVPDLLLLEPLTPDRSASTPRLVKLREFNPETNTHSDIMNPISFITWVQDVEKFFIGQMAKVDDDTYYWTLSSCDRELQNMQQIARGPDEKYQINYLWNEYDSSSQSLSLLLRNEHDPFNLNQTVYSVNVRTGAVTIKDIDTRRTFSCYHTARSGDVFAPSVGAPEVFFPQDTKVVDNEILAVDLKAGNFKTLRTTGVKNTPWQGGCVHRGLTEDSKLLHVYRGAKEGSYVFGSHAVSAGQKDVVKESVAYGLMHSFIYVKE